MVPLLIGSKVTKRFGGLSALENFDFLITEGELVGLIGPNGAGKTTLFNCISGLYPVTYGEIEFAGRKISGLKPHEISRLGIGRTFQIPRSFANITVLDNVMVGALACTKSDTVKEHVEKCVDFVGLARKKDTLAKGLTFHEKRMLEIARALSLKPRLVLLDEVAAGLNPSEISEAMYLIRRIRSDLHITVLWVEHVMKAVMGCVDRVLVMNNGRNLAEGTPEEIANNDQVIEAYLGEPQGISK